MVRIPDFEVETIDFCKYGVAYPAPCEIHTYHLNLNDQFPKIIEIRRFCDFRPGLYSRMTTNFTKSLYLVGFSELNVQIQKVCVCFAWNRIGNTIFTEIDCFHFKTGHSDQNLAIIAYLFSMLKPMEGTKTNR